MSRQPITLDPRRLSRLDRVIAYALGLRFTGKDYRP